jgi:sugar phosphate isomerase/epimerase
MSSLTRRRFLGSMAAAAVPIASAARGRARPAARAAAAGRLPLAFSTLGCPAWEWPKVLDEAARLGYSAIELRGIQGDMDLPKRPELSGSRLKESLDQLAAHGLRVSDLGCSAEMHVPEAAARTAQLDDGRRFIDLAHAMGVRYVRVFGNKLVPGEPRAATIERIVAGLRTLGAHAEGGGVEVLLESHGDFCRSPDLLEILNGAGRPNVALLWDAHHTCVAGKETPAETWKSLGRFVRHTHLKDSRPAEGDEVRYVPTGEGTVPVKDTVTVLAANGYKGYYCFEWEKKWHPEIDPPEVAFPHYARTMSAWLAEAGVKA